MDLAQTNPPEMLCGPGRLKNFEKDLIIQSFFWLLIKKNMDDFDFHLKQTLEEM